MKASTVVNIFSYILLLSIPCLILLQARNIHIQDSKKIRINTILYEEVVPEVKTEKPTEKVVPLPPTQPLPKVGTPNQRSSSHTASKELASSIQRLLAKNVANSNDQSPDTHLEEKINDVNAYSDDHEYLLVLFTTEEGDMRPATRNTIFMFNLFQLHFNCRCIFYTTTPEIIRQCKELNIMTTNTTLNPYGLPYIGDMYKKAASMYKSSFYGYINADILISSEIFGVLEYMNELHQTQYAGRLMEICHNAFNVYPPRFSNALTLHTYDRDIREAIGNNKGRRGISSVDMFILSNNFVDINFQPIVVARSRVDSYMLYMVISKHGILFDTADAAPTVHQGLERYTKRARGRPGDDFNWNQNILKNAFADMSVASGNIKKTANGYTIERRSNIVKRKV